MNNFKIIKINSPEWNIILKKSNEYDFYHTALYHKVEKGNHEPILCIAEDGENSIAIPFLIRKIENSKFRDITSVYGYCGPIFNKNIDEIPKTLFDFFKKELKIFFDEYNIVSVFSRLHPLIKSKSFFNDFGRIVNLNKTVAINLKTPIEEQRKKFRKSNKSELNQLRRKGFVVIEATKKEDIDIFIDIYYETMNRVEADKSYFFKREYFYTLLDNKDFESKLLIAKKDDIIVAGAIFTITDKIMQYHLAGTTTNFIKETPMKLILDEARLKGSGIGLHYMHLGGGVGGSDDDSLFKFKSGFSDDYFQFSVWKYIHNNFAYNNLVEKNNININSDYFPLYRTSNS